MQASRLLLMLALGATTGCANLATPVDTLETPLTKIAGDAARGREVFASREAGNCVLCHAAPGISTAGNIGPPMQSVGARLTAAQLRLRVVDITRLYPEAVMPAFHRMTGLEQVASRYRDKPVLSGQQVEDVVAYLGSLK